MSRALAKENYIEQTGIDIPELLLGDGLIKPFFALT